MGELREAEKVLLKIPNKERIIELLHKTHAPGVQNWTTGEQQEMYSALRALAFFRFRDEKIL